MVTLLIIENEEKIRGLLKSILEKAGYKVRGDLGKDNIIQLVNKQGLSQQDSLQEKIIELEESLYKEKQGVLYKSILDIIEKPLIEYVLERSEGNQLKAARILGINRNTIRAKIKRLGISVEKYKQT